MQIREKVLFVTPTLSQPRFHKRAKQVQELAEVSVVGFERKYYSENKFPPEVPVTSLGTIADGQYARRVASMFDGTRRVRRERRHYDRFYAFGFDAYIMARFAGFSRGIIEIGDLRAVDGGYILKKLEGWVIRDASAVVVTAPAFCDYYVKQGQSDIRRKMFILENKVSLQLRDQRPVSVPSLPGGRIRIGVVGLFRYRRPLELLFDFARRNAERFEVHCFGDGPLRPMVESAVDTNIKYHGSFRSPEALPRIYRSIDLNFVVYDAESKNVRMALPNKLYESAFFGVPILCATETALGEIAQKWRMGIMVPLGESKAFDAALLQADRPWIEDASKAAMAVRTQELIENDAEVLAKVLAS